MSELVRPIPPSAEEQECQRLAEVLRQADTVIRKAFRGEKLKEGAELSDTPKDKLDTFVRSQPWYGYEPPADEVARAAERKRWLDLVRAAHSGKDGWRKVWSGSVKRT